MKETVLACKMTKLLLSHSPDHPQLKKLFENPFFKGGVEMILSAIRHLFPVIIDIKIYVGRFVIICSIPHRQKCTCFLYIEQDCSKKGILKYLWERKHPQR